jgi:hypothetical protein
MGACVSEDHTVKTHKIHQGSIKEATMMQPEKKPVTSTMINVRKSPMKIDPEHYNKKMKKVLTSLHDCKLKRRRNYQEPWICSNSLEGGCKGETSQF